MRIIHAVALGLLGLAAAPLPVAAQRGAAIAPRPVPRVVTNGDYDVVLLTAASAATLDDDRAMLSFYRTCRRYFGLQAADSSAIIRSRPWDWNGTGVRDVDGLTILVSRQSRADVDCRGDADDRAVALARGFRVTADTAYPYDGGIQAVELWRGGLVVEPTEVERLPETRATQRGLIVVSRGVMRLTVPLDATAPDSTGAVDDLAVVITVPDTVAPIRLQVPGTVLRVLWEQVLAQRSARRSAALGEANAPLVAALRRAGLDAAARTDAQVRLGTNLVVAGDLAAGRVVLGAAVRDEPCLSLGAGADAAARRVVAEVRRPRDRCRTNMPLTLARATAIPGFGLPRTPARRFAGIAVLATVAGSLAASQGMNNAAEDSYAAYLAVDGGDPGSTGRRATDLYDQAESQRKMGTNLVILGTATWAASIVEAWWAERRQIRRMERVIGYVPPPARVGVTPRADGGRVGLAVTFF